MCELLSSSALGCSVIVILSLGRKPELGLEAVSTTSQLIVSLPIYLNSVPSRPTSPEKFTVPHVCARFGPGGQLLKVIPNLPSEGQPALVEIHSLEVIMDLWHSLYPMALENMLP